MSSNALPGGGRYRWIAALGVSFLALLALALVPAILARQDAELERELAAFSLARPMFPKIELAHLQEMRRIEQYVNSGDSSFIALYDDHVRRGGELLNDLRGVISGMPVELRVLLTRVQLQATAWRELHAPLMGEGPFSTDPLAFRENMEDDLARHDSVPEVAVCVDVADADVFCLRRVDSIVEAHSDHAIPDRHVACGEAHHDAVVCLAGLG